MINVRQVKEFIAIANKLHYFNKHLPKQPLPGGNVTQIHVGYSNGIETSIVDNRSAVFIRLRLRSPRAAWVFSDRRGQTGIKAWK